MRKLRHNGKLVQQEKPKKNAVLKRNLPDIVEKLNQKNRIYREITRKQEVTQNDLDSEAATNEEHLKEYKRKKICWRELILK